MNNGIIISIFSVVGILGGVFFVIFVLGKLFWQAVNKDKPIHMTEGHYKIRCGGRIGNFYLSFPFVKLIIEENIINIGYMGKKIDLKYQEIYKLQKRNGILTSRMKILHRRNDIPRDIELLSPYCSQIKEIIDRKKILDNQ